MTLFNRRQADAEPPAAPAKLSAEQIADARRSHEQSLAAAQFAMPSAEEMERCGTSILANELDPALGFRRAAVEAWFTQHRRRDRDTLADWMVHVAMRDVGSPYFMTQMTRERFLDKIEPVLASRGRGIEDWVSALKSRGQWGGM